MTPPTLESESFGDFSHERSTRNTEPRRIVPFLAEVPPLSRVGLAGRLPRIPLPAETLELGRLFRSVLRCQACGFRKLC
jgi:hypothetical protein